MNNKNNKSFKLLVLFLISVILCISSFGIATWARYRSVVGNNIVAQIAKWSFKVNGEEEQFADINLADTISFEHVENTTIAPGTYGSFDLEIDASGSEVSLDYYIDINIAQKPTNMKFYADSQYTNEIQIVDNTIQIEDEILLADIATPVTKTIYWKWEYRTNTMPSETVINNYLGEIDGLQTLINEYNEAGKTAQQKQEIAAKINDKIDTKEAGGDVHLGVTVKGIQKHPSGFGLKSAYITSSLSDSYSIGETVGITVEYTENIYADGSQTAITEQTAPKVEVETGSVTTSNNEVVKVASISNANIKLAEGTEKYATFVSVNGNKINYEYTVKLGETGKLKIKNITGNVYNAEGATVFYQKEKVKKEEVNLSNILKISTAQDMVNFRNSVNSGNTYAGVTVKLMNDIDLSSACSQSVGSWIPIGYVQREFRGIFDGDYYTISNLYSSLTGYQGVGLFGRSYGEIKNVNMVDSNVYNYYESNHSSTAALCGINYGTILNCSSVSGHIEGRQTTTNTPDGYKLAEVGGIAGNNSGIIDSCYNGADIKTVTNESNNLLQARGGGITGGQYNNSNYIIRNCYNYGNIEGNGGAVMVGGIIGVQDTTLNTSPLVENCYNYGNVTAISGRDLYDGGIMGTNGQTNKIMEARIVNCYTLNTKQAYYYRRNSKVYTGCVASETLKTYASQLGNAFTNDSTNINNGYPVLKWQVEN